MVQVPTYVQEGRAACDACGQACPEEVYHCTTCPSYDQCSRCYGAVPLCGHDGLGHAFLRWTKHRPKKGIFPQEPNFSGQYERDTINIRYVDVARHIVEVTGPHPWSPQQGTVTGDVIHMFGIRGNLRQGTIYWDNNTRWVSSTPIIDLVDHNCPEVNSGGLGHTSVQLPRQPASTPQSHIGICIDRSYSMLNMHNEVVSGVNSFIREQATGQGLANVTILQFDESIEGVVENTDVRLIPTFNTREHFVPRGQTALLDAIGATIEKVSAQISSSGHNEVQACCVIATDGMENCSKKYSRGQIFSLITEKKRKGWNFIFLGANQDAIQAGASFGVPSANCLTYAATGAGFQSALGSCSLKVAEHRATGACTPFSPIERGACI